MHILEDHIDHDYHYARFFELRLHDPFLVLGKKLYPKDGASFSTYTIYRPNRAHYYIRLNDGRWAKMRSIDDRGLFQWSGESKLLPCYPIVSENTTDLEVDPYSFLPTVNHSDLLKFNHKDIHWAHQLLGSKFTKIDGISGTRFVVWAPNAERVSVVCDKNQWDGRIYQMRCLGGTGVWELFVPGIAPGEKYKYEIKNRDSGQLFLKTDPYAHSHELRPNTASVVTCNNEFEWNDRYWLDRRTQLNPLNQPMSIYEVHLGSWANGHGGEFLNYRELADRLLTYVKQLGFTHIQILPITEFPFDGSWGYQVTGYFAPTSRFGSVSDFKYLVNKFHENGIGVLLDWVPGHFPRDNHGLAEFDGTKLYEHEDPRLGEHKDWGTLIFNYGRQEVRNFLLSSAHYWMEEFHLDGLRVDAVASMLYLDYSREEGEWVPNQFGGNENLDAIDFIKSLNILIHRHFPGAMMIAEESTSWPMVSSPVYLGGLGFTFKWNMGWMNDTLSYMQENPVHRKYHHNKLTFSLLYAFSENFVLPLSHDEVVHGKRSMLEKMPGDDWQKFSNLRLLYMYQFAHPGKKLTFMGNEIGQGEEWNENRELNWSLLEFDYQKGVQRLFADLNQQYVNEKSLHFYDSKQNGFQWVDCNDNEQSIVSFIRRYDDEFILAIFNFTPVVRHHYRLGVPEYGVYYELLNSDSIYYSGSNVSNGTEIICDHQPWQGQPYSINITVPPLAGIYLKVSKL